MAVEAAGSASKIQLIPWDPTNEQHAQRLYEQRVACTWDYESIPQWKDQVLRGDKFMYWIVSFVVFCLRKWMMTHFPFLPPILQLQMQIPQFPCVFVVCKFGLADLHHLLYR